MINLIKNIKKDRSRSTVNGLKDKLLVSNIFNLNSNSNGSLIQSEAKQYAKN